MGESMDSVSDQQHSFGHEKENGSSDQLPGLRMLITLNSDHEGLIDKIEAIWKQIQLPEDEVKKRHKVLIDGFSQGLTTILTSALEKQASFGRDLEERVSKFEREIHAIQELLDVSRPGVEAEDLGLFAREINLRTYCNELIGMKMKRQTMLSGLLADNQKFAGAIGVAQFPIPDQRVKYRMDTLHQLQDTNEGLQVSYVARLKDMAALHGHIEKLQDDIKHGPVAINWDDLRAENFSTVEEQLRQLIFLKEQNIKQATDIHNRILYVCRRVNVISTLLELYPDIKNFFYDPCVITQLAAERDRLEKVMKESVQAVISGHRERIERLYIQIYARPEERTAFLGVLSSDDFGEALLDSHEKELMRLEEKYDDHREIFNLLDAQAELLRKKMHCDEQETDPVVMQNRGGILLKIQSEKKKVTKDLTKIKADIQAICQRKDILETFQVFGLSLEEYFSQQQVDMEREKTTHFKDRKKEAPKSATKRTEAKDTPTAKRLKTDTQRTQTGGTTAEPEQVANSIPLKSGMGKTYTISAVVTISSETTTFSSRKEDDDEPSTMVLRTGKIARKLNFGSGTTNSGNSAGVKKPPLKGTPKTATGKR